MSKNGQPIRALVIDDSDFMRNRLSMMLMKRSDLQVVGTAMNGHDAIEQAKRTQPDVVTLYIEMPSMNGFGSI
jgi:chemotaxis response regulator CheB